MGDNDILTRYLQVCAVVFLAQQRLGQFSEEDLEQTSDVVSAVHISFQLDAQVLARVQLLP